MKVLIRVDASFNIGTGHVIRCLTLANALREQGVESLFVCREHEGNLFPRIRAEGFEVVGLPVSVQPYIKKAFDSPTLAHADWLGVDWRTDAHQTKASADDTTFDWLVVDHYALDFRWESMMRTHCKRIMVIDDLADRDHDCDLLLDQNLVADLEHRYDTRISAACSRLLGPKFALLQPQYAELHSRTPPRIGPVQRILVYFGGADNENLTGRTISAFLSLKRVDVALDVVINPAAQLADAIRNQARPHPNITIYEELPSLAPLMLKADLAIGGGGATAWERCCLGLPSIVVTLAHNQKAIASELHRQGFVCWIGHQNEVTESMIRSVLMDFLKSTEMSECSRGCMRLVDGKGVERVSDIVALDSTTKLKARMARHEDEELILRWNDNRLACEPTLNQSAVDLASYRIWFYKSLRDVENCRIIIVETKKGFPIGQVRLERTGDEWEIDYVLDELARHCLLTKKILMVAIQTFRQTMGGMSVFTCVKKNNSDSQGIFEDIGYKREAERTSNLSIAICTDSDSWINETVSQLVIDWLLCGHRVAWTHSAFELPGGDVCFYLSYGRIVDRATREKYKNNLVVHSSALPKGRGWSPASWMILEGEQRIPVTLLEAIDEVDAGPVYAQDWINLDSTDLVQQWRSKLARATIRLVKDFVEKYPDSSRVAQAQEGEPTYYPKRREKDSVLDINQSIRKQFNLFRIVDNDFYPAYFKLDEKEFVLKIYPRDKVNN